MTTASAEPRGQNDRVPASGALHDAHLQEPIKARVKFDNNNCMNRHEGTPQRVAVELHVESRKELASNQVTCLDCHGEAHPRRSSEPQARPTTPD